MISNIIYWITQKRWLFIAFSVGTLFYLLPVPEGLTSGGYHTLIIVICALILIIFEPVPLPATALLILILQVVMNISSANQVAASFMNDAVFFIMGSLMLAVAIVKQGLDTRLALAIIRLTGNKTWKVVGGLSAVSAILASFMGEHAVTALMMPVGLSLIRYVDEDPKKVAGLTRSVLFSIAYGSMIGSVGTPSGGSRNVIMMGYFSQFGLASISYLEWIKYAYPFILIELPLLVWILWKIFDPEPKILETAIRKLTVQVAKKGKMTPREISSIMIFFGVFLGWVFLSPKIGLGIVALMGVFLYLAFGLVDWSELNRSTNWGVILLFGSIISMGFQMRQTGADVWLVERIFGNLQFFQNDPVEKLSAGSAGVNHFVFVVLASVITALFSNFLGAPATIALMGPIVLNMGVNPLIVGFSSVVASSFTYLTVVGSPARMLIYSTGLLKPRDYLKAGSKVLATSFGVLFLLAIFWWPLLS